VQTAVLEVYQPALFPSCGPNSATPLRCTSRSVSPPAWRRHGQESGQQLPTRPPAPLARAGADPVAELLTAAALPPVVHEQMRRIAGPASSHHGKRSKLFREFIQDWLSSFNRFAFRVEDQQAMSEQTTRGAVSDYEIIGGGSAVSAVVNDFYGRVLGDSQLAPYFEEVDLARLKRHQVLLVTKLLGGPDHYTGRPLDEAHDGLGITHDDLAAVVSHFAAAMKAAGAADDIVLRAVAGVAANEPDIVEAGSSVT
jgi:hemoglobin